jgi:hypothetical protein
MSVLYAIILGMTQNWFKYDYVCSICDALIEITNKSNIYKPHMCCGIEANWLSVVNATIYPTEKKEETNMETTTLREQIIQEMELRYGNEITELKNQIATSTMKLNLVENDEVTTKSYSESDVRALVYRDKSYQTKMNEYYRKESQLRTLLENVYADSNEQDTLTEIAEIFDVPLTKEIEVTAYIRVDMTIEIDMAEGDYDLEDMVRNQLTVDSFGSEISVNDYAVDRVEEGAY